MKTRTLVLGGLGAAALVAVLVWAFAPRPLEVELGRITQAPFETTVDEEARTQLRDRYVVSAPVTGRLERIALQAGDTVEAGAAVAALAATPAPLLDARSQQELAARVEAAGAAVARAVAQVEASRVTLAQARNDARRSNELAAQGFVAPTRVEADRLAVRAAERGVDAADAARRMAQQELEAARAATGAGRAEGGGARRVVLKAPVAGRVLRVLQASEGTVVAGTPLIELGDVARIEVVAELLTTDALRVRPGAPVRVEHWGGPGVLDGRVDVVEPGAFTKVSALGVEEQRVRVRIALTSPPARWAALGDGYRTDVRIVTRHVPDALVAPVSAVFPRPGTPPGAVDGSAADGASSPTTGAMAGTTATAAAGTPGAAGAASAAASAAHAVFVVVDGRARERPVRLGGRNDAWAWLLDGPPPGTPVIVYPPTTLRDGDRVRERRPGAG